MADWRSDFGSAVGAELDCLRWDEPLSEHTTFRIGGRADVWLDVSDEQTLARAIEFCRRNRVPWWVLGRGSNVLVSDQGLRGVVLHLAGQFSDVRVKSGVIDAGGGAMLDFVAEQAEQAGLSGAAFLAGIPGTVGGGLRTNAGAFGQSLADIILRVFAMNHMGDVVELGTDQLHHAYRCPVVEPDLVVLRVLLRPGSGSTDSVSEIRRKRRTRQPEQPSAGSFFKNPRAEEPKGGEVRNSSGTMPQSAPSGRIPAGRLIEQCGLKGRTIGGAQVSEKHANFIVNTGNARFVDVYELSQVVKASVEMQTGIMLEDEVQVLP